MNNFIKPIIGTTNIAQSPQKITVTIESTGIFLGVLVSGSALLALGIKAVSNIKKIYLSIIKIEKNFK